MFDQDSKHAIVTFGENGIEDLTEIYMLGGELADDELALVTGAMAPLYIGKTYFEGEGWVPDWLPE